jgi:hypothetical protein
MDNTTVNISHIKTYDRLTSIRRQVRILDLRLRGYVLAKDGDDYVYSFPPLADSDVIAKATALLEPFCQDTNLITSKSRLAFERQFYYVGKAMNDTLISEMGSLAENYSVVMTEFLNILDNIGDIIVEGKSQDFVSKTSKPDEASPDEI